MSDQNGSGDYGDEARKPGAPLYIVVTNWRRFQHYKDRNPPWIKAHVELLHDHNYLSLNGRLRGILHGIWLLYAASNGELPASTSALNHRLGFQTEWEARMVRARRERGENTVSEWRERGENTVRQDNDPGESPVRMRDLKRLEYYGWITLAASPVLADRPPRASTRARAEETETETQEHFS